MSLIVNIVIGLIILLIIIGIGLGIYFFVKSGQTGSSGPSGQTGQTGSPPPPVNTYISNVIAQTNPNCPSGYIAPGVAGTSNGNLKQSTGGSTPNIYLCMSQTNDPNSAVTDLRIFQFGGLTELDCPQGNEITYNNNGSTEFDFEKGCGASSPYSKLCLVGPGGPLGPIQDILVTASNNGTPSCPSGYFIYNVDNHYISGGIPGDLNRNCDGQTVMLCIKR